MASSRAGHGSGAGLAACIVLLAAAVPASAEVCVWRNPERTMARLYPEARDYRTVTTRITPEARADIERRLGARLAENEAAEFAAYAITDARGRFLGWVAADAEPGEFGVIEIVAGVRNGRIVGVYVQRTRERAARALQDRAFLDQFRGRSLRSETSCGSSPLCQFNGPDVRPAEGAEAASRTVTFGVKKILVMLDVLRPSHTGDRR